LTVGWYGTTVVLASMVRTAVCTVQYSTIQYYLVVEHKKLRRGKQYSTVLYPVRIVEEEEEKYV